uniref:TorF family putative porin n=1 Tax=Pseudacidovorax intermedius TaxID=433924 RepID=UPI0005BE78A2
MTFRASLFCVLGLGLIALNAHAQSEPTAADAAPQPSPLTANVSLTSNYKFRGQDQDTIGNNGFYKTNAAKPAIQGGFDYAHESGFYVGNWNSSVNWQAGNSIESDIYGGYKFKAGVFDLDFGVLTYIYP